LGGGVPARGAHREERSNQPRVKNPLVRARDELEAHVYFFARGKYAARDARSSVFFLLDLNIPKISGLNCLEEFVRMYGLWIMATFYRRPISLAFTGQS
jgi:hypothetical protein